MNRNEQINEIEEMAKSISASDILCHTCGESTYTYCADAIAKLLVDKGYRRASEVEKETFDRLVDAMAKEVEGWKKHFESLYETAKATLRAEVAKEIFAELKTVMIDEWRYPIIAELKKKYTEVQDENS